MKSGCISQSEDKDVPYNILKVDTGNNGCIQKKLIEIEKIGAFRANITQKWGPYHGGGGGGVECCLHYAAGFETMPPSPCVGLNWG